MAITDSEFLEKQQKYSRSIDQIDQISGEDVQNSVTLPGVLLDENGLPKKFVQARMSVFTQPAIDAAAQCQNALQQLTAALSDAAAALSEAQRVRSEMESATETATTAANKASQDAQAAISNANAALSNAQSALADAQTALANAASSKQTTDGLNSDLQRYLAQVSELITTLQQSIASADDTANHPTYIGADNYVYQWNKQTKAYTKTNIYVRGEGFHTSKTFNSVAEMEAYDGTGLKEGDFVVINTNDVENPDNAKLYTYDGDGGFDFFVDMSGAIGFTGKTPQISIGTITTLPAGSSASASLTDDGTDIDGNPKFNLNLSLPKGDPFTYADFTAEQIAELQRPATDAIALCQAATAAANKAAGDANTSRQQIEANEQTRQDNEVMRQNKEAERISNEDSRVSNETTRQNQETQRVKAELLRESAETEREEQSSSDHDRAETDHSTAESDHGFASSDHSTAESDHRTASLDHSTAVSDHQESVAQSAYAKNQGDHAKTEGDRCKALNDHPQEIHSDGYIYAWNETTQQMENTNRRIIATLDISSLTEEQLQDLMSHFVIDAATNTDGEKVADGTIVIDSSNVDNVINLGVLNAYHVKFVNDVIDPALVAIGTNADDIDAIKAKIPAAATSQNQLADKDFLNSSISTATATYRNAHNLVSDLNLTVDATKAQIEAALGTAIATADKNDYCFVQIPNADATPTEIARVDRYKHNGTEWKFEYTLNNSGFTASQWAALNSGITSGLVVKLCALPTNAELTALLAGKQDNLAFATDTEAHSVWDEYVFETTD